MINEAAKGFFCELLRSMLRRASSDVAILVAQLSVYGELTLEAIRRGLSAPISAA